MTDGKAHVHFIGIGGSSMSGLAKMTRAMGSEVSGSDRTRSHKTEDLQHMGMTIHIGHAPENVDGADLVVYTAAIPEDNPELSAARQRGIPCMERAAYLGRMMDAYQQVICVSGTHGKTTTTSMIAQTFSYCGENPTIHIGGELDAVGGGGVVGGKEFFVCEACEYKRSFLSFHPTVAVILNIDEDHLDYYKDIDDIESAFDEFAHKTPRDGVVIGWGDDFRVRRVLEQSDRRTRTFGLEPFNELRAEDVTYDEQGRAFFTATLFGHPLMDVQLKVAGEHSVVDALACIAVAETMQLPMTQVAQALGQFTGAHRRFELTGVVDGVRLYTDYGHNPAEIRNALHIAALQPHNTLWSVWQPHTYSRTKTLFDQFLTTFGEADKVLITDICAARETDPGDISSDMLIGPLREKGVDAVHTPSFDDTEAYLRAHWQPGDLVITHGCGDIDLLNEQISLHGDTKEMET